MTELEMTKLCAEAIGESIAKMGDALFHRRHEWGERPFDPLRDDAQAMALVKKMRVITDWHPRFGWGVAMRVAGKNFSSNHQDLNRAIVECVAKMQKNKKPNDRNLP